MCDFFLAELFPFIARIGGPNRSKSLLRHFLFFFSLDSLSSPKRHRNVGPPTNSSVLLGCPVEGCAGGLRDESVAQEKGVPESPKREQNDLIRVRAAL